MRFEIACLMVLMAIAFASAQQVVPKVNNEERSFFNFTTFTLIKSTTTTTSTFTSTTTCTTFTGTLTTCSAGRRRRGLFYDEDSNRARRGLFFNEDDNKETSAFLASPSKKSNDPVQEVVPSKSASNDVLIPLEVQAGFAVPEGVDGNRFLLAFGTSTRTSIVVTTTTSTLTAICSSTTGFSTCSSGK